MSINKGICLFFIIVILFIQMYYLICFYDIKVDTDLIILT